MGSGGGHTTTTTSQGPPQLLNEGREGYDMANTYYQNILGEPPIYTGQRVEGLSGGQKAATRGAYDYFGVEQPYMSNAKAQIGATAGGQYDYLNPNFMGYDPVDYKGINSKYDFQDYGGINSKYDYQSVGGGGGSAAAGGSFEGFKDLPSKYEYTPDTSKYDAWGRPISEATSKFDYTTGPQWKAMDDPEMQRQISAASEPIMAALKEQVMPGIRDSGSIAGQGGTSTRGDVARQKAIEGYGRTVGSSVIAPLMMQQSALQEQYSAAIQDMKKATAEGDANRAQSARTTAAQLEAQSHDVTNQIQEQSRVSDATNKGRYASDWLAQQTAGEQIKEQYSQQGLNASIANMQDTTSRAIADAQQRLGYADLDTKTRSDYDQRRLGYAGLDTNAQLAYDQLNQGNRLSYDQLMQGAYGNERDRQLTAAGMAPAMDDATARRFAQLNFYGGQEQMQGQRELDAARQAWEEPIFRQSTAADRLLSAAGVGPGSSTTDQTTESGGGWLSTIMSIAQMAAMAYMMS